MVLLVFCLVPLSGKSHAWRPVSSIGELSGEVSLFKSFNCIPKGMVDRVPITPQGLYLTLTILKHWPFLASTLA